MADHLSWRDGHAGDDEPVDVPRYIAALKRGWPVMLVIVVTLTLGVLALSLMLPKTYEATAQIVMTDSPGSAPAGDVDTVKRRLATVQALLTTRDVLARAATRLAGTTPEQLQKHVHPTVDRDANIIDVVADDGDPAGAAAIANSVALSFLDMQRAQETRALDRARAQLTSTLARLRGTPGSTAEVQAIRARLSELGVSRASVGSDLSLAQAARPPDQSASPRPVRNTVFAFFASAFIAVLVALGLDQLAPRLTGARQLSRLIQVPVLATMPSPRARRRRASDEEAFRALHASLVAQLPVNQNVVLVAGAFRREGPSDVTASVAKTLARAGHRTLLVCGDTHDFRLADALGIASRPGFAEALDAVSTPEDAADAPGRSRSRTGRGSPSRLVAESVTSLPLDAQGALLDVLPPGPPRPGRVLASDACATVFDGLRRSLYRFVVVDGPPLLGTVEGQLLAQCVDGIVVVCRVDRMTPTAAVEMGELLSELPAPVLGVIAVGSNDIVPRVLAPRSGRVRALRTQTRASGTRARASSSS